MTKCLKPFYELINFYELARSFLDEVVGESVDDLFELFRLSCASCLLLDAKTVGCLVL